MIVKSNFFLSFLSKVTLFPSKNLAQKGFSIAEAMITLLIVSIAMAAMAPIMSKKMKSEASTVTMQLPSGMVSFFNKPCASVDGDWSDVPNDWRGRYPRIVGSYKICDKDNSNCKDMSISYNDKYEDAMRKIYGEASYYGGYGFFQPGGLQGFTGATVSGVIRTDYKGDGWQISGERSGLTSNLIIDSSAVLPTAEENRVKTVGLYMCVKD